MIESAEKFERLRTSYDELEYSRAATDPATMDTWLDVIERFAEMREWVADNSPSQFSRS